MKRTLLLAALTFATPVLAADAEPGRLPGGVEPINYALTVTPDAEKLSFIGQVDIDIAVARPTTRITLNAADLMLDRVALDGTTTPTVKLDADAQTATFVFAKPVAAGRHKLSIGYRGKIYKSAAGLFALDYEGAKGPQRMLVTQFEPADARRLLPLWDEPARKATFDVAVAVPAGQDAVSNMPLASKAPAANERTLHRFQRSPRMSSYLLFVGMGDVERRTRKVGDVEVGVVTRKGAGDQAMYALDAAAKLLPYFNDYFGTPYPLPKLDMIAGPGTSQFFSAMENWGAILYFERRILIDPNVTTESDRQQVFQTIAHEIAHQWFGNLTTMRWWDDLWLNEGFASWMEAKATEHFHPEWHLPVQTAAGSREAGMRLDARASTHPIIQTIRTVDEANQAFDSITYNKGEAVIRMLETATGEAAFRAGVRRYMAKYAYSNTVTDQLWAELSAASGKPVEAVAHDFTKKPGVPLVKVASAECVGGRTAATLSQDRFHADDAKREPSTWRVPLRLSAGGATTDAMVSGAAAQKAETAGCGPLVVNSGQTGYFRTLYAPPVFAKLMAGFAGVAPVDQVGILSDTRALGLAGYQPLPDFLRLAATLKPDADPLVWSGVADALVAIDGYYPDGAARERFRAWARGQLKPAFDRIGWSGGTETAAIARERLILALGRLDDPQIVAEASRRFDGWLADPASLPAGIRTPVLSLVAEHATPAQWDRLRERAAASRSQVEQLSLYEMLGFARDPALARKALDLAISGKVAPTTGPAIVRAVAVGEARTGSPLATNNAALAFDFAVANEARINAMIEAASRSSFIPTLADTSADPALARKVRAYAEAKLAPAARGDAMTAVAAIEERAAVRTKRLTEVDAWLQSMAGK